MLFYTCLTSSFPIDKKYTGQAMLRHLAACSTTRTDVMLYFRPRSKSEVTMVGEGYRLRAIDPAVSGPTLEPVWRN
jgi:hypothetical protein